MADSLRKPLTVLVEQFRFDWDNPQLTLRYNIAPTQDVAAMRLVEGKGRLLQASLGVDSLLGGGREVGGEHDQRPRGYPTQVSGHLLGPLAFWRCEHDLGPQYQPHRRAASARSAFQRFPLVSPVLFAWVSSSVIE